MVAYEDSSTLGPTRLGFSDEKDVDLFVNNLARFERGEMSPDEWRAFRLCNGVYGQRQDDVQMIRVKFPHGIATPEQLEVCAQVAERYANGKGHITTRQNIQFHFVKLADAETVLRMFAEVGVTTREACGNAVRNITGCPYAGVSKEEPFDHTPHGEALTRHLLRGKWSSSLPRKFKIAFGGCCGTDCVQAHINDLGYHAMVRDGRPGFRVTVGGGLSTLRRTGLVAEEFLPAEEILEVGEAVVRVFHRIGNRQNRAKARLKWAIDQLGPEGFLAEYRKEREAIRAEGGRPYTLSEQPRPPAARPPLSILAQPLPGFDEFLRDNVRAQKQDGFSAVTVRVVLGDLTPEQFRGLGRLAREYGERELRFTNEQNLVLRYVPTWRLATLHRELADLGLARAGARTIGDVTSCPGASSCKLAVTQSKGLAALLTSHVDATPALTQKARGLSIKVSGCPNSCGQHHIAGLGFQGGVRKVDGKAVPQYLVFVGGGFSSTEATFARLVTKIPARRAPRVLERLVDLYEREKKPGESPDAYFSRVEVAKVKSVIGELAEMDSSTATADDFIDLGETRAFVVETSEGECAA
ncbi:MAG: nitrite/sulfite reductase [Myxococcota bacterium]